MANIFYGANGEGMGHAMRSEPVIRHLLKKGHQLSIFAGGRAFRYLHRQFSSLATVREVYYFPIHYERNAVNYTRSYFNAMKHLSEVSASYDLLESAVKKSRPDLIITDFEPFTAVVGGKYAIPRISIDNIHIFAACKVDYATKYMPWAFLNEMTTLLALLLNGSPGRSFGSQDHFFITTFFYPPRKPDFAKHVRLFPPLLRDEVLALKPTQGSHILVYQTSTTHRSLFRVLKRFPEQQFVIYGFDVRRQDKNLTFKKFSRGGFFRDLASAKAVITNGGFTLISEALYLRKPIFSVPVRKQFEQIVNATYLGRLGCGVFHDEVTKENLSEFLSQVSAGRYRKSLKKVMFDRNKALFRELDRIGEGVGKRKK